MHGITDYNYYFFWGGIIHDGRRSWYTMYDELVEKFNLNKWKKMKRLAEERNQRTKRIQYKYWAVLIKLRTLPEDLSDTCSYRSTCML